VGGVEHALGGPSLSGSGDGYAIWSRYAQGLTIPVKMSVVVAAHSLRALVDGQERLTAPWLKRKAPCQAISPSATASACSKARTAACRRIGIGPPDGDIAGHAAGDDGSRIGAVAGSPDWNHRSGITLVGSVTHGFLRKKVLNSG
jgi:hypothetical protein